MADDSPPISNAPTQEVFNAAGEVAKNIVELFRNCTRAMQTNDIKNWWINLESAYMEVDFSLKEKEREKLDTLWKKIDPYKKEAYSHLKEYHLELRRLCTRFFTMGESQKGPAIWRR